MRVPMPLVVVMVVVRHLTSLLELVLRRELAAFTRCDDALHVGMAPFRRVALRRDQRMLARRVQHPVAEWADVARRLEVLRRAHCPPPRLCTAYVHANDDTLASA